MKKFSVNYIYLLVWVSFVLYASLSSKSPDTPLFHIPNFDKIVHFGMYFGLTFLLIPIQNGSKKRINISSVVIAVVFGLIMELTQYLMHTGRDASLYDALANTVGAMAGLLFYRKIFEQSKLKKLLFKS